MTARALVAGLLFARLTAPQVADDPHALQRMVATERAFAAATAELGVRDGFLTFFAADSVQIRRGSTVSLVPAREALASQPLPKLPLATRLVWEPFTGQVSADGQLGWLTGGYLQRGQATEAVTSQGAYFSVWKRQPDGTWRVWLDEGVSLPRIWDGATPFRVAPEPDAGSAGDTGESIEQAEDAVSGGGAGWRVRLAAGARLHVHRLMPLAGREAILSSPRGRASVSSRVLRIEAARSDDLAIAIGVFDDAAAPGSSDGSWVRVWKRDRTGRWRIVFQTETPTPAKG